MKIRLILMSIFVTLSTQAEIGFSYISGISSNISDQHVFQTDEGKLVFEDSREGNEIVICVPGMGDTRGQFRLLAPLLAKQGYRVVVLDPRGQGDSEGSFTVYSPSLVGTDLVKLIDNFGSDVFLIGNSSGAASVAWAAAERPAKVKSIVLLGAFLRDHPMGLFQKLGLSLALRGPWAPSSWVSYYKSLFGTNTPADQTQYTDALVRSLNQKNHVRALMQLAFSSKSDVTARLSEVKQNALVVMGTADPDFKLPEEEADWILTQLNGEKFMVKSAGHYPHLEFPNEIATAVNTFFNRK